MPAVNSNNCDAAAKLLNRPPAKGKSLKRVQPSHLHNLFAQTRWHYESRIYPAGPRA